MSNPENQNEDLEGKRLEVDEDIDEELLALAGPPPSLRYGIFTGVVIALLIAMMVWFFPELEYALQIGDPPTPLGEAADLDLFELEPNSFVSIEGLPHVTKSIKYKEGVKWFSMSDNVRHFFPLTGQPNIYVQWKETDEYKAFRDPNTNPTNPERPSSFEGHLVRREDLVGANFERILVFYDCLKVHPLRRCNYCLGKSSLELCREFFTCVERNKADECVKLVQHIENPGAVGADQVTIPLKEHRLEVGLMRIEEMAVRIAKLQSNEQLAAADRAELEKLKKGILNSRIEELKIRAASSLGKIEDLDEEKRGVLVVGLKALKEGEELEKQLVERQKLLNEYADIGQALENNLSRLGKMKAILAEAVEGSLEGLGQWDLDLDKKDSVKMCEAIDRLEAYLFTNVAKNETKAKTPVPEHGRIIAKLDALRSRIKDLQHRVTGLEPGAASEFDRWARTPNVVVGIRPAEVKDTRTLMSFHKLEDLLASVSPSSDNLMKLVERVNGGIDELNALKKKNVELAGTPGMREMEVVGPILALEKAVKEGGDVSELTMEVGRITLLLMDKNLYTASLAGMPNQVARLEKIAAKPVVDNMVARLDGVAEKFEPGDFVLFDKDPPLEKTWVLLIYAILIVMVLVNFRKMWRFYIAWKS